MKKIKYIFKRIFSMNFNNFFKVVKKISKKTKKPYLYIMIDIIYCGIKYMAGYVDYDVFEFYNLNRSQRKTIVTRGINNKFVETLNDKSYVKYLDNKLLFNEKYDKYLKRNWLNLEKASYDDFTKYFKKQKVIIAKPTDMSCGKLVEKIEYTKDTNLKKVYNNLIANKQYLLEDYVIQHKDMSKLYPTSVNTLRIVTVLKDNVVHVVFRSIRIGNNGNVVDNFNHGGLFTTIDEDGVIRKPAVDKQGNIYEVHPYTKTKIIGYKIPLFDEAIEYVKKIAKVIPEVKYVGWDIAITDQGPLVIEGNPFPGHDIYQSKVHLNEDGNGLLPVFDKILK